jgi:hypothetical protein
MKDWYVDGHYIAAEDAASAVIEAGRLYNFDPEVVRPWTAADQTELERLDLTSG